MRGHLLLAVLVLSSVVVAGSIDSAAAQAFSIPEERIHAYYNTIFAEINPLSSTTEQVNAQWCRAYAMLAQQTRAQLTGEEYGRAMWQIRWHTQRERMEISPAVYNDDKSVAKVSVRLILRSFVSGLNEQYRIMTLVREQDDWKIVLDPDLVASYRAAARRGAQRIQCAGT